MLFHTPVHNFAVPHGVQSVKPEIWITAGRISQSTDPMLSRSHRSMTGKEAVNNNPDYNIWKVFSN